MRSPRWFARTLFLLVPSLLVTLLFLAVGCSSGGGSGGSSCSPTVTLQNSGTDSLELEVDGSSVAPVAPGASATAHVSQGVHDVDAFVTSGTPAGTVGCSWPGTTFTCNSQPSFNCGISGIVPAAPPR